MSNPTDLRQVLGAAMAHHQGGRLTQAEPLYRQVLAAVPNQPEAMHLLGMLMHQTGRSNEGFELIRRSVAMAPSFASLSNMGEVLRTQGKLDEAIACLRRAVELNPNSPDVHNNLGRVLADKGAYDEAENCFIRATQLAPTRADLLMRLCMVRTQNNDPHGAVIAGKRAIELLPNSPEAWTNLCMAYSLAKKHDLAIEAGERAVSLVPDRAEAHYAKGNALMAADRRAEAEAVYLKSVELNPDFSLGHRQLAALYDGMDDYERSIASLKRALKLQPKDLKGWVNLSTLLRRSCDIKGALAAAEEAMRLDPSHPDGHGNIAMALLALGDYPRGFAEYEWRWRCESFTTQPRDFPGSVWDGSDPTGRTILVHTEQGYGDTIQFVRYIPMLAARGAKVILESWPASMSLLGRIKGVSKVLGVGMNPPSFDLHIPLLSLPKIFGTTLQTVPNEVPYLFADPARQELWKEKIAALGSGLKVGLIWAGNVKPDRMRTCPIENLAPLAEVEGVQFVSLQKRDNPRGAEPPPPGLNLHDISGELRDFSETAAVMMNLDLIITIDTGPAHLAGALGRPTWTMLPWGADWRWLEHRLDTPWYPTMRLFRQPARSEWLPITTQIAQELRNLVAAKG